MITIALPPPSSPAQSLEATDIGQQAGQIPDEKADEDVPDESRTVAPAVVEYLQHQQSRMQARVLALKSQTASLIGFIIASCGVVLALVAVLGPRLHSGTVWVGLGSGLGLLTSLALSLATYFPRTYQEAPFEKAAIEAMLRKPYETYYGATIYNLSEALNKTVSRYQHHVQLHEWAIRVFLLSVAVGLLWAVWRLIAIGL